jgi:hypothetical protein
MNDEEFDVNRRVTRIKTNSNDRCKLNYIYIDNYLSKELNPKNSSFDRVRSGTAGNKDNSDKGKCNFYV